MNHALKYTEFFEVFKLHKPDQEQVTPAIDRSYNIKNKNLKAPKFRPITEPAVSLSSSLSKVYRRSTEGLPPDLLKAYHRFYRRSTTSGLLVLCLPRQKMLRRASCTDLLVVPLSILPREISFGSTSRCLPFRRVCTATVRIHTVSRDCQCHGGRQA